MQHRRLSVIKKKDNMSYTRLHPKLLFGDIFEKISHFLAKGQNSKKSTFFQICHLVSRLYLSQQASDDQKGSSVSISCVKNFYFHFKFKMKTKKSHPF